MNLNTIRTATFASLIIGSASLCSLPAGAAENPMKPRAASTAFVTDQSIVNRILDRWYPVASQLEQDAALWRAQFKGLLDRTSPSTLQAIDAIEAKEAGANRTLLKLYESIRSMAVSDVGAQMAKQISSTKAAKLGSATTDLVFIGLTPCRIVDSRNVGTGLSAGTQRNLYYYSDGSTPSTWSSQGGDPGPVASACPSTVLGGILGNTPPAAAMINISAVNTNAAGNWIAWGGSIGSIPNTSVLNWDHGGEIISNTTIVPWGGRTGGNLDFTVRYNGPSGFADLVVDVMGYFVENAATALDCTTATASGPINIGTGSDTTIGYPACPAGYTRTGGYCNGGASTGTSGIYVVETGGTACVFRNLGGSAATGNSISQCCRVPGR